MILAKWRGTHVLEVAGKQHSKNAGCVTYEVSADGRTLTVADPDSEHVTVFDRQ